MRIAPTLFIAFILYCFPVEAQEKTPNPVADALNGFSFRSIGPAFMSGRIADIAIDPTNENT